MNDNERLIAKAECLMLMAKECAERSSAHIGCLEVADMDGATKAAVHDLYQSMRTLEQNIELIAEDIGKVRT